jgi:hypothetical protein
MSPAVSADVPKVSDSAGMIGATMHEGRRREHSEKPLALAIVDRTWYRLLHSSQILLCHHAACDDKGRSGVRRCRARTLLKHGQADDIFR